MPSDRLDASFTSLADPTRRAILARLAQGGATVNELAEPFDMSLPADVDEAEPHRRRRSRWTSSR